MIFRKWKILILLQIQQILCKKRSNFRLHFLSLHKKQYKWKKIGI